MDKLSDRDMLMDVLLTEKYLATLYNAAEAECTNQRLRNNLHTLHSAHEAQHSELFKELHQARLVRHPQGRRHPGKPDDPNVGAAFPR